MSNMVTLLRLPNEILDQILDETVPDGIEHSSRSCRPIYSLAETKLKQHRIDKSRYFNLILDRDNPANANLFSFLREIFRNPRVAFHPRTVTLAKLPMTCDALVEDPDFAVELKSKTIQENHPHVLRLLETAPSSYQLENSLADLIHEALLAVFLTFLVNVQRLEFKEEFYGSERFQRVIGDVLDATFKSGPSPPRSGAF